MSIKINGLKYLDANDYSRIIVRQSPYKFQVDIKPGKHSELPKIGSDYKMSSSFDRTDEVGTIEKIIESFLRNATIDTVIDPAVLPLYDGNFSVVKGTRELDMRLFNQHFKSIGRKVMDKYILDRLVFCEENKDINRVELYTTSRTSSYVKKDGNFGNYMQFYLKTNNNKLMGFESEFLKKFLMEKFISEDKSAIIREETFHSVTQDTDISLGMYVTCGNFVAKITSSAIKPIVSEVVCKYNQNKEEQESNQLKLKLGGKENGRVNNGKIS